MKGKAMTVLGPVEPESLGLTLTHEHLLHDLKLSVFKQSVPDHIKHIKNISSFCLENLGHIRQYPYSCDLNLEFTSVGEAIVEEMNYFKSNGGGTIVDNCSIGLRAKGQAEYLEDMSRKTGVKIVAGSGFYVSGSQSQSTLHMGVESLCEKLRQDLMEGMDGTTNIKCGCIGEVGCSYPITDFEKKSLVSTAIVQEETGAPVIIHPGRDSSSPEEIFRVFQEAGGRLSNTVMSHLDRTFLTKESLLEFASLGSYCEFDLFGIEVSLYQLDELTPMPSDAQRMESLRCLIQEGYGDKIVVAHDIHTKHRLMKYGGHGYSHILLNVVPIMEKRGFQPEDIYRILYSNPASWLTFL